MNKEQRLSGIDLCRGLAAYAVILVHSGDETWGIPMQPGASEFRSFFYFAVPFFLATSFYFMVRKIDSQVISWPFWKVKYQRIIIPYIAWSVIYLITRTLSFLVNHQFEKLKQFFQDPLAIILFGGASYHLYFLPLLFTGSFSIIIAYFAIKKKNIYIVTVYFIFSLFIYKLSSDSGNSFELGNYIAFKTFLDLVPTNSSWYQLFRIVLVFASFFIRCLPYLFFAIILRNNIFENRIIKLQSSSSTFVFVFFFIFVNVLDKNIINDAIKEIILGYSFLLIAISLHDRLNNMNNSKIIKSLGICSFGIYLIHPLFINIVQILSDKILPQPTTQITIISILFFSLSSFFLSWYAVNILSKNRAFNRYLFGVFSSKNN